MCFFMLPMSFLCSGRVGALIYACGFFCCGSDGFWVEVKWSWGERITAGESRSKPTHQANVHKKKEDRVLESALAAHTPRTL